MIKEIKLNNHKGIQEISLSNLEHINIISGKNNSGKSSVLETIMLEKNRNLGRTIHTDDIKSLIEYFEPITHSWSSPSPGALKQWFKQFIPSQINTVIYEHDIDQLITLYSDDFNKFTSQHYGKFDNFRSLFTSFLAEHHRSFKPFLIPPKRALEDEIIINTNATPLPKGENLLNLLFFLKNQDPHSKESETYKNIYENFAIITNGHYFNIVPVKDNKISLVFTTNPSESNWIKAADSGLGLREILTIISFIIAYDYNFIMIEEPENHIHPDMQRKLISFIKSKKEQQFLLATHSNIFLDPSFADKIYRTFFTSKVEIVDNTNRASILSDLGYSVSDNLVSDLIILTEGPTDRPVIEEMCRKMGFWENYNIKFWPMGGDIMSQLDLSTLSDNVAENKIIALIDSDTESQKERNRFKKKCEEMNIECFQLKRYSIENYIPLETIKAFPEFSVSADIKEIKPDEKVENQIGINIKKNLRKLTKAMDIMHIEKTDLYDFCIRIKEIVENT